MPGFRDEEYYANEAATDSSYADKFNDLKNGGDWANMPDLKDPKDVNDVFGSPVNGSKK